MLFSFFIRSLLPNFALNFLTKRSSVKADCKTKNRKHGRLKNNSRLPHY